MKKIAETETEFWKYLLSVSESCLISLKLYYNQLIKKTQPKPTVFG